MIVVVVWGTGNELQVASWNRQRKLRTLSWYSQRMYQLDRVPRWQQSNDAYCFLHIGIQSHVISLPVGHHVWSIFIDGAVFFLRYFFLSRVFSISSLSIILVHAEFNFWWKDNHLGRSEMMEYLNHTTRTHREWILSSQVDPLVVGPDAARASVICIKTVTGFVGVDFSSLFFFLFFFDFIWWRKLHLYKEKSNPLSSKLESRVVKCELESVVSLHSFHLRRRTITCHF